MNVKNVINDNDYEFSLAALTASFLAISSLSPASLSSSSSCSSISSIKENQFQLQQNQQQDLIKICVLLFDTYQKICLTSDDNPKPISISRQSIQESLLPGLSCLREIFHNHIILNSTTSNSNDYVLLLDTMIHKIENMQTANSLPNDLHTSPSLNNNLNSIHSTPTLSVNTGSMNEINSSPLKVSPGALVGDMFNATGVNVLSSSSASSFSSTSTVTSANQINGLSQNAENNNFKSFVFKGFSSFKDQSKDKLSNFLLTNKTFKK